MEIDIPICCPADYNLMDFMQISCIVLSQ